MKKQVIIIHGGNTFKTYRDYFSFLKKQEVDFEKFKNTKNDWKDNLQERLGEKFEIIFPAMPNKQNTKYCEWKIWFEKGIPYFNKEVVLIGHSMGGIFLAKYLSENNFPKKIKAVFLVAAPFDVKDRDKSKSLADFILPKSLNKFEKQANKIFIYHSKDDHTVPFVDLKKYKKAVPGAKAMIFEDRGHFNQEEFPEIVRDIKSLY